jgi:hypothetical protein
VVIRRETGEAAVIRGGVSEILEEIGNQGADLAGVGFVGGAELFAHPFFFESEFAPEGEEDEGQGEESPPFGARDGGTEESEEQSGVDGVADQGVGAGGDEFVVVFEGNGLAPVFAEIATRPDGEKKTCSADGGAQPEGPEARRKKALIQECGADVGKGEESGSGEEESQASPARGTGFKARCGFDVASHVTPIEDVGQPHGGKEAGIEDLHESPWYCGTRQSGE